MTKYVSSFKEKFFVNVLDDKTKKKFPIKTFWARWPASSKKFNNNKSQQSKMLSQKILKCWYNCFFCKTIYSFRKTGHKIVQQTNHNILLTNVSIKRCIKTSVKT